MQPLVPIEIDLRGMPFMPLDVNRLRDSQLSISASGDQFRAAVLLWCASWGQVPAGSLPDDDMAMASYAGYGRDIKGWRKVKEGAMRGFVLCDDGRWYHPVIAEKAMEAWDGRQEHRARSAAENDRKKRERAWRSAAFAALRAFGIVPQYDVKTHELRRLVDEKQITVIVTTDEAVTVNASPSVTSDVTPPVTVTCHTPVMAKTGTGTGTVKAKDQKHPLPPAGGDSADAEHRVGEPRAKKPAIPYDDILDAFRKALPQLEQPQKVTPKRRRAIEKAWDYLEVDHRSAGAFKAIFLECAADPFYNGTGPYRDQNANWRPTFDFIIREDQFAKIYDRAMTRRQRNRAQPDGDERAAA
jgi:uncharacterized protein YdaU (DUF1376 family)